MKKVTLTLLSVALVLTAFGRPSTNYKNKQLAIFSYEVTIDPSVNTYLEKYKDLFEPEKKIDPIEKALKNNTYMQIEQRLRQEIGMDILPIGSFQDRIKYDKYNYPDDNISKVIRVGNSKYYFKITMIITAVEPRNDAYNSSRQGIKAQKQSNDTISDNSEEGFHPSVSIVMTVYNNKGILPVDKFQGMSKATIALPTDATLLNGIVNNEPFEGKDNLMGLINEAITDLIINMAH